jgi:hypothetical protein
MSVPMANVTSITRFRRPGMPSMSMPSLPRPAGFVGEVATALKRRWDGTYDVDEWGFDRELFHLATQAVGALWDVYVGGAEHVPAHGGALLAVHARPFTPAPALAAHGIERSTNRAVRFTGLPDVAPVGPLLRKLGGALARPDEIEGLLRDGHLVAVWLRVSGRQSDRAGEAPAELLAPSLHTHVPVLPVAVIGHATGRNWRVEVGHPVKHRRRPGPLAEAELADEARLAVQRILDEVRPSRRFLIG